MGVYEGRGQLAKAVKELQQKWSQTRMSWNDNVAEEFEKRYLEPIEADLRSATTAMEHMSAVLHSIRRAVE
jgi:hypothetical protein